MDEIRNHTEELSPPLDWTLDENKQPINPLYGTPLLNYEVVTTPHGNPCLRKKS